MSKKQTNKKKPFYVFI